MKKFSISKSRTYNYLALSRDVPFDICVKAMRSAGVSHAPANPVDGENGLSPTEAKVLNMIRLNEFKSIIDASRVLNLSHTPIERALSSLVSKGLIRRVGSDRCGHWN